MNKALTYDAAIEGKASNINFSDFQADQLEQDWERGITIIKFDDGSKLAVQGPDTFLIEGEI